MNIYNMQTKLKEMLCEKRFNHSIGVMETAVKMAELYGADVKKARIAGLLHDCAKNLSYDEMIKLCDVYAIELDEISKNQHSLIHAYLGAEIAKREFGIDDEEIYDAIYFHTIGYADMPILTKIIYIADVIEPSRNFDGVEKIRELAYINLDEAIVYQTNSTIKIVLERGNLLHPSTVTTRNYYLSR